MKPEMLREIDTLRRQLATFATVEYRMSLPSMMAIVEAAYVMARDDTNTAGQRELVETLPITHASVSRAVTYWSQHSASGVTGKGFIHTSQNLDNRRFTDLRFSPKGAMFVLCSHLVGRPRPMQKYVSVSKPLEHLTECRAVV